MPSTKFDGEMVRWYHYSCVRKGSIDSIADVQGLASVKPDDQERVRKLCADYIDLSAFASGGASSNSNASAAAASGDGDSNSNTKGKGKTTKAAAAASKHQENVEILKNAGNLSSDRMRVGYAESNRSSCRVCQNNITMGEIRIGYLVRAPNIPMPVPKWNHLECFVKGEVPPASLDQLEGLKQLESKDEAKVKREITNMIQSKAIEVKVAVVEAIAGGNSNAETKVDDTSGASSPTSPGGGNLTEKMRIFEGLPPELQKPDFQLPQASALNSYTVAQLKAILEACNALEPTHKLKTHLVAGVKSLMAESGDEGLEAKLRAFVNHPAFRAISNVSNASNSNVALKDPAREEYHRALAALQDENRYLYEARVEVADLSVDDLCYILWLNRQFCERASKDVLLERISWGMVYGALPKCPRCSKYGTLRVTHGGHIRCENHIDDWNICPFVADSVSLHPWRFNLTKPKVAQLSEEEKKRGEWPDEFVPVPDYDTVDKYDEHLLDPNQLTKSEAEMCVEIIRGAKPSLTQWKFVPKPPLLWARRAVKREKEARALEQEAKSLAVQSALGEKRKKTETQESKASMSESQKKVKVQLKGRCAVNQAFDYAEVAHVLDEGTGPGQLWDAPMSFTDLATGRNSFYHLQLLVHDTQTTNFWVFRQWGRVGSTDQGGSTYENFHRLDRAKECFRAYFRDKTGNEWGQVPYTRHPKRFFPVETVYAEAEPDQKEDHPSVLDARVKRIVDMIFDSKRMQATLAELEIDVDKMPLGQLSEKRIRDGYQALEHLDQLIQEIFPEDLEDQVQKVLEGDPEEKVSSPKSRTAVLLELLLKIKKEDEQRLLNANNRFYTLIPHTLHRTSSVSPLLDESIIKTRAQIKAKAELLQTLQDMIEAYNISRAAAVASKTPEDADDAMAVNLTFEERLARSKNASDIKYRSLKNKLTPLPRDSPEWKHIESYLTNTHAATHSSYTLEIQDILVIEREGEKERFDKHCRDMFGVDSNSNVASLVTSASEAVNPKGRGRGRKKKATATTEEEAETKQTTPSGQDLYNADPRKRELLWHGSRLTNFGGILSQGLRIAPPEAPVTGYMFGKGIYLADMVSKSANYCFAQPNNPDALILLCEAALGEKYRLTRSEYVTKLKDGLHSTYGMGGTAPDPKQCIYTDDGMKIPLGTPVRNPDLSGRSSSLLYNEYIVYNEAQVRLRYLLNIKFRYKHYY